MKKIAPDRSPQASKTLPLNYQRVREINLQMNTRLAVVLNLLSLVVFAASGFVLILILNWLRPGTMIIPTEFNLGLVDGLRLIGWVLGLSLGMIVLHEGIHGIFFWGITHEPVRFAFKGAYAYAAAPGWFFPRSNYIYTCLAPFTIITLVGFLFLCFAPVNWLLPIFFVMISNAAGATGDLYIALLQLFYPVRALYQDQGDIFTVYLAVTENEPFV